MVFGGGTPGGTRVVYQDIHITHALQGLIGQSVDLGLFGAVGGNPAGINTSSLQLGNRLFQVSRFARAEHDLGTGFAQGVGHLQAQAARAASNECVLAGQVEQFLDGAC